MRTLCVLVCLLFVPLGASADTFSTHYFQASLSPSAETPEPITVSMASGSSLVRIHIRRSDTGEFLQAAVDFDATLSVVQEQNLVNMHIHRAALGVGGPVVIDSVFGSPIPVEAGGTARIIRQFIVEADDASGIETIEALLANPEGYYVNVHSSAHPPGVARGQLHPVDLAATLGVADQAAALQASVEALQAQVTTMQDLLNRIAMRFSINP
jgi:hypothetical protein